jgi:hypothetical protein
VKRRGVVVVAAIALLLGACAARVFHTFTASPYNVAQNCLEGAVAVDVIDGPDPGPCLGARCWVTPSGAVFVSAQACDGPTDYTESTIGPCNLALAAARTKALCGLPIADAGTGG